MYICTTKTYYMMSFNGLSKSHDYKSTCSSSETIRDSLEQMRSEMANISDKLGTLTAPREAKETEDEGKLTK